MSKILVFLPGAVSHAIELRLPRLHIGRHAHNTIALPDARVSGVHALLQQTETGWWIEDLGSTNGTWINGKRMNSSILLAEDVLRIGGCTLRLLPSIVKSGRRVADPGADQLHEAVTMPADFGPTDLLRP
ncbi:FHA domain-containing protein FhaB [mine drainage metagenome]|uniref:FHA domain-containing protein FhaB n=1 Tax=mine drainage metagenome TaxID=410659 RepID=A0A1J5PQL4_9ZZZZ